MQKAKKNLWYSRRRRPLRYLVYLPCGLGARVLVRGVAAPEALDEGGGGDAATDHVLLTLLLLHLQGEARTQDALWCAIVSMLLLCFLSNELYTKGKKVAPVVTFCPILPGKSCSISTRSFLISNAARSNGSTNKTAHLKRVLCKNI